MRFRFAICWASLSFACASHSAHSEGAQHASHHHAHGSPSLSQEDLAAIEAIQGVHGGSGPWVVAGFRMGRFALARLGLPRGSFDLEVVHRSPREVQFSCIADGAAAATGASLGRLNLTLELAAAADTRTTYRNKHTGALVTLETVPQFAQRYADVPREQLGRAGIEVLHLPDAEIFREVPTQRQ